ncbi:UvrD-helicase domain-containing protein [Flavobacterium aciduliphilum]|uniref:DNA 3'-5' helicase n=1 Tax=Flavobacterium aciduliphilum TaxID=1101402 RepID=A0A328YBK4_9FLAO|nr:UvrD-helicase domain-containing protein [Flavobacterium aciduliphilum]RAR71358.1 ATP-dependent exoDNAse (exonuclease V) beta subunit [Flavobacterium aciduliphilum]
MQKPAFSIYDASAGSGKTYTLVKEYLKIILLSKKQDAYRTILAITFTNKAVHEMKTRVVESLSEFAKEDPTEKALDLMRVIHSETGLTLIDIKTKAKSIIKNLIHNYAAFDISTIDKFTHRVIRAFAHDLNLPITFEVSLDTENLLTETIDAIIARAGEDAALTQLLVDYTLEKANDDKSWDVSNEIFQIGKLILNENNRTEIAHLSTKTIPEFVSIKEKLERLSKTILNETKAMASDLVQQLEKKGIDSKSFSGGYFPKHLQSIQEGRFNPNNKTYHEVADVKINKAAQDNPDIEHVLPGIITELQEIYAKFEKINLYQAFLKNITPLSLLNTISNELDKIQKEQNILSIAEFNKLINEQIQNQPAPFIYERLGERYKHFFIDEFQDTSEMQWHNLIPLIDNALVSEDLQGERGSLLLVGDPKQSIYRWRGGKAEQFIELSQGKNPFHNPDMRLEHLDTNWRSFSEIITFNNAFFKFVSKEFQKEDYKKLYQNQSAQKTTNKQGGYVSITFIPTIENAEDLNFQEEEQPEKTTYYLNATQERIESVLNNGFSYEDIVILTRKKAQGIAVANYLTAQGIPILSSESLLISSSSEVQCVVNILRFLAHSNDSESKANFLYYLSQFQSNQPPHDFIATGIGFQKEIDFELWLQDIEDPLDSPFTFNACRKKSLYEATEIIIARFIPKENRNAYIQYFLDVVLECDLRKQLGLSDFLNYWEQHHSKFSIPAPEGKNAVRIMTIHKSKGLEFPVVIFPFAEEDLSKTPREKMWLDANESELGLSKVLVDKSGKVATFGEDMAAVYQAKKQEDLLDVINVLYVALTRAEEQLHIISGMNFKNDGELPNNLSSFFIEFLYDKGFESNIFFYSFGTPQRITKRHTKELQTVCITPVSKVLDSRKIKIAQRESLMWNTKQQKAIEFGTLTHEILAFVKTKNEIDLAITKAIENGILVASQKEPMTQTLLEIVQHEALADFFSESHLILNEQTIIQKEQTMVKPDRMEFNSKNEVFLLDYKTGSHVPKHKLQLENYQQVIESMGYAVIKKVLVYIGENIEVVNL